MTALSFPPQKNVENMIIEDFQLLECFVGLQERASGTATLLLQVLGHCSCHTTDPSTRTQSILSVARRTQRFDHHNLRIPEAQVRRPENSTGLVERQLKPGWTVVAFQGLLVYPLLGEDHRR